MDKVIYMRNTINSILFILLFIPTTINSQSQDTLLAHFNVFQCDSLIQGNALNPNFVILDVRTDAEYDFTHLEGGIQRDFFHDNFQDMLDVLPRHKFYLVHCASGSRSTLAFNMMVDLGFYRMVNMQGGINAWRNAGLPTTSDLAPLTMALSSTLICGDTVPVPEVDTIELALTNRANDTLYFTSVTSLEGTEFSTDFDLEQQLLGAEDYSFHIFYEPIDELKDSIDFVVGSNGGEVTFTICRTGELALSLENTLGEESLIIYPNPVRDQLHVELALNNFPAKGQILDMNGRILAKVDLEQDSLIDVTHLAPGSYVLVVYAQFGTLAERIFKMH